MFIFRLRSLSCLRTELAAFWSLYGPCVGVVIVVVVVWGGQGGGRPGEKGAGGVREAGEEGAGRGRKRGK